MESDHRGAEPLLMLRSRQAVVVRAEDSGFALDEVQNILQGLAASAVPEGSRSGLRGRSDVGLIGPVHTDRRRGPGPVGVLRRPPNPGDDVAGGLRAGVVHHGPPAGHGVGDSLDEPAFAAKLASARTPTDLARLLAGQLRDASAATVAVLDRDGVLRMAGRADDRPLAADYWSRVPLHCSLPLVRLAAGEQAVWLDGEDDDRILTWLSVGHAVGTGQVRRGSPSPGQSLICMVSVAWPSPSAPTSLARLEELAARVGRRLRDLASMGAMGDDPGAPWLDAVLDAIPTPAALLLPVRDPKGAVVDFIVDRCNDRATDLSGSHPDQISGRQLLEVLPGLAVAGVLDAFLNVLESGGTFAKGPFTYEEPLGGILYPALLSVQVQRVGGGLLASWKFHDEQARLAGRIADAERLMHMAWADWNLVTGEIAWSQGMYSILGLSGECAPLGLHELSQRVADDDLPVIARAAEAFCERRAAVTFECRLKGPGRTQVVNVTAEPILNTLGKLIALRCVIQDVTVRRGIEAALVAAREAVEAQRRLVVEEMQQALLAEYRPRLPGLRVAVRYRSAEDGVQVGGDWFDATALPDGRVLFCIGDASGHGLQAAARMAQLRNALLGIAHTGTDPARMLGWLNIVACHSQGETAIATAIASVFDPVRRSLSWAQAGHPAPVLVRSGRAWELANPVGTALGVGTRSAFGRATVMLRPGDSVILYTDGLLERRADPDDSRMGLLLDAAARATGAEPEALMDELFSALDTDPEDDRCVIVLRVEESTDRG